LFCHFWCIRQLRHPLAVILDNHFKASLKKLNPTLPESARVEAYQKVINLGTLDIMENKNYIQQWIPLQYCYYRRLIYRFPIFGGYL
jgi:hypothetical protein